MTQKEIRDQIENLIRMGKTISTVAPQELRAMDLVPVVHNLYSQDSLNLINNNKTLSLLHQWNRQLPGSSPFEGTQAYKLGEFVGRLGLKSYETLLVSNYIREVSKVQYFGLTASPNKVGEAAIKLVNFFNDLASKNLIRAVLAPLMSIELVGGNIVLVSYIAIDQPNEALVQSMYGHFQFKEGGIPPELK